MEDFEVGAYIYAVTIKRQQFQTIQQTLKNTKFEKTKKKKLKIEEENLKFFPESFEGL